MDRNNLKVVPFPDRSVTNVAEALRTLATQIEAGAYGDAHNCAWVIDTGDSGIEVGLTGVSAGEPGPLAYYLFGLAKRKLESV